MDLLAYIRVSKVGDRAGDSYQTEQQQMAAIEAIVRLTPCARIIGTHIDRDESGGTMDRPEVKKVIAAVEAGKADGVVVAYLDRWARTVEALKMIKRWSREGKTFISATDKFDATTSQGSFALGMMLLVAEYYRDTISERWNVATASAIRRGVHIVVPYGYRRGNGNGKAHPDGGTRGTSLVLDPDTAPVVRRIFDERLKGIGVSAIADGLNRDEIKSRTGQRWNRQAVRAVLLIRTYMGEAAYGEKVTLDAHPAIVSRQEWEAVQREPRSYKRRSERLLDGLVRCGGCGYLMGTNTARWNCNRHHAECECPSPTTAPVERLEAIVTETFLAHYGDISAEGAQMVDPAVAETQQLTTRLRKEFEAWRDDSEMRDLLGDADYRAGLKARKHALDDAEAAAREAVRRSGAADLSVRASAWAEADLTARRQLVTAGIEAVVVHRAPSSHTPLADRVEIIWPGELHHDGTRRGFAVTIRERPSSARVMLSQDAQQRSGDLVAA